jgi:ubiquinone/menaquinone biosynthesis C-methylase UbiE
MFGPPLTAADAAVFENAVVPRYLSFFTSILVDMMLPYEPARIANLGCRNGYPDALIAEKMQGASIVGVDPSAAALELARTKAANLSKAQASYTLGETPPVPLPDSSFTHVLAVHPICRPSHRPNLLAELRRLLVPGGQALIALPLRKSFPEISDMGRECALKQDLTELGVALDAADASRPTIETIAAELEAAGFGEVDVDVQLVAVSFNSGREFLEDPIARLMVFPDATALLEVEPQAIDALHRYVHHAIAKYWSEGVFELTVNVGCASARRL